MIEKKRRCAAFAVCGSFCTLEAALDAARALPVSYTHLTLPTILRV